MKMVKMLVCDCFVCLVSVIIPQSVTAACEGVKSVENNNDNDDDFDGNYMMIIIKITITITVIIHTSKCE